MKISKTEIALAVGVILAAVVASILWACSTGCEPLNGTDQHVCACDAPSGEKIQVSSEKPPRSGKPSWEANDIHAEITISSGTEDQSGTIPNGGVPVR